MTPKVTQEHLDERRMQILAAAVRAFAREGLDAATMRGIAAEAGLAVGTLYLHFDNKAAVLSAILERSQEAGSQALRALVDCDDPFQGLRDLLIRIVESRDTEDGLANSRLDLHLRAEALRDRRLGRLVAQASDEWRTGLADALRRGIAAGTVRADVDAEASASALVAMLWGITAESALETGLDSSAAARAVESILKSLEP